MTLSNIQKFGTVAALSLATIFGATSAQALESKQCGTVAEISAALDAEGQYEVISGKRTTIGDPHNIFTTDENQRLGYNIEVVTNDNSKQMCVRAKYTNIRFNQSPDLARPTWARFATGTSIKLSCWSRNTEQ